MRSNHLLLFLIVLFSLSSLFLLEIKNNKLLNNQKNIVFDLEDSRLVFGTNINNTWITGVSSALYESDTGIWSYMGKECRCESIKPEGKIFGTK